MNTVVFMRPAKKSVYRTRQTLHQLCKRGPLVSVWMPEMKMRNRIYNLAHTHAATHTHTHAHTHAHTHSPAVYHEPIDSSRTPRGRGQSVPSIDQRYSLSGGGGGGGGEKHPLITYYVCTLIETNKQTKLICPAVHSVQSSSLSVLCYTILAIQFHLYRMVASTTVLTSSGVLLL